MFKEITTTILDLLFPIYCSGCNAEGAWLCKKCEKEIPKHPGIDLLKNGHLDTIIIRSYYAHKPIQKLIRLLKFSYIKNIAITLGKTLEHKTKNIQPDIITFVPLHRIRKNERGFNQAEEIAKHLSERHNIPIQKLIKRVRNTRPQTETAKKERKSNLLNAFILEKNCVVKNKTILILDDVYTSGATLSECAKILKKHGAKKVIGICVAARKQ